MSGLRESHLPEQAWFIPGRPGASGGPLIRYRPRQSIGAASGYVKGLTDPGDLVMDLFCQGPAVVRETVGAGRRALGLSVNPLLLVAAHLGLDQRDADALNAAFTRLADSPKGDVPLRHHLASLYRSACPSCGAPGTASWFAWDRDGNYPFKKAVRCPRCAEVQEGTPDDEDIAAARRTPPRGLAYYYALDRVAPPGHPARERAAELVELYTPRNLSALLDLAMRLEGLEVDEDVTVALTGVLLDCFDAGSSLDPYGEERPRPRTLRLPSRYIERNIWLCFEEGFSRLLAEEPPSPVHRPADVAALVRGEAQGYALVGRAARDAGEVIPPGSATLIFADPPRPDGVFWALSALWSGWLWESPAARALRPFLRRRRFDWDWHWRVLRVALKTAGPLLTTGGHLITLFSDPDDALLESVFLAANGAGYVLEGWGCSPEVGCRLVWRWEHAEPTPPVDVEMLKRDLAAVSQRLAVSTLRERGEPASWSLLHASVYAGLTEQGLLARTAAISEGDPPALTLAADAVRRALEAAPVVQLTDQERTEGAPWWLVDASGAAEPVVSPSASLRTGEVEPPLADRAETLVGELLAQPVQSEVEPRPDWSLDELINGIYARLPGTLTPDLTLVKVCIESYSVQEDGTLRLRPEDDPRRRAAELEALRDDLVKLGKRLGFEVKRGGGWDVRWLEEGRQAYLLAVSATAALGPHLLVERTADEEAQRCLVLPGGRAQLVDLKLRRDPRLAFAVEAGGWQFIKFRHLRRLVAEEELDRHALKTVLGLDPIVEREAAQIPLF